MKFLLWPVVALALLLSHSLQAETPPPLPPEPSGNKWVFNLFPRAFQRHPDLNISVITEMTEDGKKLTVPTSSHPTYVVYQSGGIHDEGQAPASKSLTPEQLEQLLRKTLAAHFYLPNAKDHPPTLLIIYHWGTLSNLQLANDDNDQTGFNDVGHHNLLNRALLIGGTKFATELAEVLQRQDVADQAAAEAARASQHMAQVGFSMPSIPTVTPFVLFAQRSPKIEELIELSLHDCYYVVASAYDFATFAKEQKQKLLWRTKITTSTDGVALMETLPALIATGGPYYGREMAESSILDKKIDRQGKVEIGEPIVRGYFETEDPPAAQSSEPQPKK